MDADYHFSEWAFLAKTDPDAFERRRRARIEQFLGQTGRSRARLEALQATIDAECEMAANPREAMLAVSRMMCNSLAELHLAMTTLSGEFRSLRRLKVIQQAGAKITAPRKVVLRRVDGSARRRGFSM